MKTKQYAVLAMVAVAAGAFLASNPSAQSAGNGSHRPSYKLEGAWIAKVPGTPMQWGYAMSSDPSGNRATLTGSVHVKIPPQFYPDPDMFADTEYQTDMLGELVMTGRDTGKATAVFYGMRKALTTELYDQVTYICVVNSQITFTAPGKITAAHNVQIYLPSADVDGDGFPDQSPVACLPAVSIDTRVGFFTPCN